MTDKLHSRAMKRGKTLAEHNDVAGARQILDELPPGMERTSGFILGWYARQTSFADAALIDAWRKFKEADAFWR